MKIKIAHLYPDLMSIYGDRGNILALTKRCLWRGIEVDVDEITIGGKWDFLDYDLIFFGGGQDKEQKLVCHDLQEGKGEALKEAVENEAVLLSICGGFQLLGQYYKTSSGDVLPGNNVFEARTEPGKKRMIGNVVMECELDQVKVELVGFENHSGRTYLSGHTRPLGKIVYGYGNNGEDSFEGAVYKNAYGTYLHGPLLPKNPWFADHLLERALKRKYDLVNLTELDNFIEKRAHLQAFQISQQKSHRYA